VDRSETEKRHGTLRPQPLLFHSTSVASLISVRRITRALRTARLMISALVLSVATS